MNIQTSKRDCILTVDLEDWYHGKYPGFDYRQHKFSEHRVIEPTLKLLDIIEKFGRATFFVLGEVAENYPDLIEEIAHRGHEISCHGYEHTLASELGQKKWHEDLMRASEIISKITGKKPPGYRAPNFSLDTKKTPWAFEILEREGFIYDSSVFPAKMYYGGSPKSSRFRHKIGNLTEFPPSTLQIFGARIVFSGGFYLRTLPMWLIKKGLKNYWEKGETPLLYIHPKDIDEKNPKLPIGIIGNWIHRAGRKKIMRKLNNIFQNIRTISIIENFRGNEKFPPF